MNSGKKYRVLMLGWEYPPRFAGGLGKACQGLSHAMATLGAQIYFVLPRFPEKIVSTHLEVVDALECLKEAGWTPEKYSDKFSDKYSDRYDTKTQQSINKITTIQSAAQLFPYETPLGKMPKSIARVMGIKGLSGFKLEAHESDTEGVEMTQRMVERFYEQVINIVKGSDIYGKNIWEEIERYALMVRHMGDTHEVDVVHAHDWMTFPAAFAVQERIGVPVFLHVHATEYDRSGENLNNEVFRIEREGFRRADHIFAVSRYTAGILEKLYGVSRNKITIIYNAPENELVWPVLSESEKKHHVIFLGRLTFQKGPDHFLKAAALVSELNREAQFILCGAGEMLEKLRDLAHKLGIEKRVHFTGFIEPQNVDQILRRSRVLVMPSVSEPFGLVALEAIRNGIPVILSKQSGVREVLPRALQVDFWDHEKLADQILAALRLPGLSKLLVDEGRDQLKQLSWDRSAQQVLMTYKKVVGSNYVQRVGGAHGH